MSALSSTSVGMSLPASSVPPIDAAREPQSIRTGDAAAKRAYAEGVAFENILVNQLAQEMTQTVPGLSGSDDGLGGSSGGSGAGGSGSAIGAYSSLLPQALTTGIMSGGGTGIAMQIARSLDPALDSPKGTSS